MPTERETELESRWETKVDNTLERLIEKFELMSKDNEQQHSLLSTKIEQQHGELASKLEAIDGRINTLTAQYVNALTESSKKLESKNKIIRGLSFAIVGLVCFIAGIKLSLLGVIKDLGF